MSNIKDVEKFLDDIRLLGCIIKELKEDIKSSNFLESFEENNSLTRIVNFFVSHKPHFKTLEGSIIGNKDYLILSRLFIKDWEEYIKKEIAKSIESGHTLSDIKNSIVCSIYEYERLTTLNFTWDLYNDVSSRLFRYSLPYFDYYRNQVFDIKINPIRDDIVWVNSLTEKNLQNQKIILNKNASKTNFINVLTEFLKTYPFEKEFEYKSEFKKEITNFINTICSFNNSNNIIEDFNLSFIPKGRNNINIINFSKVFYYAQYKGIISSNQGEINKILSDAFNISERYFQNITKAKIKKELEDKSKTEDFIKKVLNPFKKRSN